MDIAGPDNVVKPLALVATFAGLSVLYYIGYAIYSVYFHPLRHIPGPKLSAISRIPQVQHILAGTTVDNLVKLHKKYGEVVRFSPNEVSFTSAETAWPDIYGFRTGKLKGHLSMQKDNAWFAPSSNGAISILIADDGNHSRGRRTLAHAFSAQALASQEVLLQGYVDQLITRLKEVTSSSPEPVDMVKWYNWTTFDIIADLLFGEPFGSLQDLETHKYVELVTKSLKGFSMYYVVYYFPWLRYLGNWVVDGKAIRARREYHDWVADQTQRRCERETQRPDFMTHIMKHNGEKGNQTLSPKEIVANAQIFIGAGSETTATLLSGVTHILLTHPDIMQKVKDEVRSTWATYEEITLDSVSAKVPYMRAVLLEALRFFPPVPTGFHRKVSKGGEFVSGYYMPENTSLCVSQYPTHHSEQNFRDCDTFVPERWMGDPKYADDKRDACQPFSFGPRNCLGKNLAHAEMRLILAKIMWSFDMELDPKSAHWMTNMKVRMLWEKPPLAVHMKAVVRP